MSIMTTDDTPMHLADIGLLLHLICLFLMFIIFQILHLVVYVGQLCDFDYSFSFSFTSCFMQD